jgi:hypothetical protein
MLDHSPILAPVTLLVTWTLVQWLWMYATRLPAISKAKIPLDNTVPPKTLMEQLPPSVRWKADNYNHLMEQPTIFYAIALTLAITEAGSGLNVIFAWFYVILRIIHSFFQSTVNVIIVRFVLHVLSTICLFGLTWGALKVVFGL